jgi:hypothetical protein
MMPKKIYRSPYLDLVSKVFSNSFNTPLSQPIYVETLTGEQYAYGEVIQRTRSLALGLRQEKRRRRGRISCFRLPFLLDNDS